MTDNSMRRLDDEIQVRSAVQAYAHAIDSMDYVALADVFTDDVVANYHNEEPVLGNANLAEFLRQRVGATIWHQHFVQTTKVSLNADTATTESAFIAHAVSAARPGKIRMSLGSYSDTLRWTAANGWKISSRVQVTGIREVRDIGDPNG
jgi:ketosteroid isomerase-like protein